jgi:hypothetical protein
MWYLTRLYSWLNVQRDDPRPLMTQQVKSLWMTFSREYLNDSVWTIIQYILAIIQYISENVSMCLFYSAWPCDLLFIGCTFCPRPLSVSLSYSHPFIASVIICWACLFLVQIQYLWIWLLCEYMHDQQSVETNFSSSVEPQ